MTLIDTSDIINGFDMYQVAAKKTAIYPEHANITYPILGAMGELGEFANKYKKEIRDGKVFNRNDAAAELGDILWYLSAIATDMDINLGHIAINNLEKLSDRMDRGVLGGSGDKR